MTIDDQHSLRVQRAGGIVTLIGLLLLVPAAIAFTASLSFAMRAQRAEATFAGAVERNSSYGLMYYPTFAFHTADGQTIRYTSNIGSSSQAYPDGFTISILYDPVHPDQAQVDSLFGVWLLPLIFSPPPVLLILIGVAMLLRSRATRRRFSDP
jgi:hypothetical protein